MDSYKLDKFDTQFNFDTKFDIKFNSKIFPLAQFDMTKCWEIVQKERGIKNSLKEMDSDYMLYIPAKMNGRTLEEQVAFYICLGIKKYVEDYKKDIEKMLLGDLGDENGDEKKG